MDFKQNKINKESRICIVGAGAAGLTAAHFLRKKGYHNITLLEQRDRVGGKCKSIMINGKCYELGGGLYNHTYTSFEEILKDCKVTCKPSVVNINTDSYSIDFNGSAIYNDRRHFNKYSMYDQVSSFAKFILQILKFKRLYKMGYENLEKEYHLPFSEWLALHNIKFAGDFINRFTTGFGYGYSDEIPAMYILRYMLISCPPLVMNTYEISDIGYQGIWEQVAKQYDVRFNVDIKSITRSDKILINTQNDQLEYDTIIFTCHLDDMLNFTDGTSQEKELFSKIRYYDYHVVLLSADKNLPGKLGFVMNRNTVADAGGVIFCYQRWLENNIFTTYHLGKSSIGMKEILPQEIVQQKLIDDMRAINLNISKIHAHKIWKYFPHVSTSDLKAGFYEKLNAMQGNHNTYYLGELLDFSSVGTTSNYSKYFIEKFF